MTRISPRAGALAQRLPDPMDAAMAFRSIVLAHKRRSSPMPYALCSRLPDPMDAARIFRLELSEAEQRRKTAITPSANPQQPMDEDG